MEENALSHLNQLESYGDRTEMLHAIIVQLEKDTGLDYTNTPVDANNPEFLQALRNDLANHLKKIAGQNQTRFMHLIYRVDIKQSKLNQLDMDSRYYENLAEMVLNRIFQKVITKRFYKP